MQFGNEEADYLLSLAKDLYENQDIDEPAFSAIVDCVESRLHPEEEKQQGSSLVVELGHEVVSLSHRLADAQQEIADLRQRLGKALTPAELVREHTTGYYWNVVARGSLITTNAVVLSRGHALGSDTELKVIRASDFIAMYKPVFKTEDAEAV